MPLYRPGSKRKNANNRKQAICYQIRISDNKKRDLDNAICTLNDCLNRVGIIDGDSVKNLVSIFAGYHKSETPGADIILIEKINE